MQPCVQPVLDDFVLLGDVGGLQARSLRNDNTISRQ